MDEMSFRTDLRTTSVACDKVVAILHQPGQEDVSFAEAHRNPVDQIELIVRTGVSSANVHQLDDYDESPFFEGGMEDSIYISNSKSTQATDAFQIKRKVIKGQGAENESVVGPSDRENATSFLEQAGSQTERKIELTVPTLDVKVDKRQLEVIYNRFGNDLVFWKPSCSETCETPDQPTTKPPTYYACKSGLVDSLDSDSSFHSFEGAVSSKFENQTTCVLNIHEMNFNAVLDNQAVQCINGQNVLVGVVLGLDSDKTRNIFICGDKASLTQDRCKILASNIFTDSLSSLNMTFQIRLETEEVKQLKIALQVNDMAMHSLDVEVFKNFWDVIKITDEPVLGYKPPAVVTELHISLINGAIAIEKPEVRPALFTFDDVYITSMVLKNTSETLFRFIVEEGSLYFSRTRRRPRSLKDCICVLDSGITDLNLKVRDEHIEFKISNNVINARVCGDSLKALCDLITSLATPANLATSPETVSEVNSPMPDTDLADNELISDALNDVNGHDEDSKSDVSEQSSSGGEAGKIDESGFWILGDDDVGTGSSSRPLPEMLSATVERYLLEELSVALSLYGGQDFSDDDRDSDKEYDKNYYETKLDTDYGDDHRVRFAADGTVNLWESLDLMSVPGMKAGSSSTSGVKDKSQGGKNRQSDVCVQLYLSKIKSLYETFEPSFHASWRFVLMINEIEIRDRVSSSKINKMLYEYCSESLPRRNNANMLFVKATSLKNDADHNDECDIKVSVKPLRVNVDQDTLMFLVEFFSGISPKANSTPVNLERRGSTASMASSPTTKDQQNSLSSHVYDSSEHLKNEDTQSTTSSSSKPSGMYVKSFVFSPDVPIRLDYQGKRMDFEQGALAGILMGLAQLNESELRLKRLSNKSGMLGLDRVALYAFNEWMKDIKRYQLPSLLGGVGPMHSFVQLFQGVRDLVWMPIDQYRKDKRIVRGLQRGASSFSTSSATAVLDLANQFLYLVQNTAQFAHDVVTPPTNMRQLTNGNQLPSSQPRDFREGMTTAYAVVRDGLNNTVRNVSKASSGADDMSGAIGGVIRQLPSCFLSPAIRVAEASRSVITGARNQIAPEAKKRDQDKYKAQTHQK
ncbi:Autophagy-related protein 2 -like protein A [Halotydeus destructor]|nr:Autophagy-related protein 2 -like protein A [Halotydeus destructor]